MKKTTRFLSLLLVLLMLLGVFPISGFAAAATAGTIPDGSYTKSGQVSFSKDNYSFDVTLTVSGGKVTNVSQTITSSVSKSDSKSKYQPNAMSGIKSQISGKDATQGAIGAVDSVSGATYASNAVLADAKDALVNGRAYTITWKNGSATLASDLVKNGRTPAYTGAEPTRAASGATNYVFDGWASTENGAKLSALPAVTGDAAYYAHFNAVTTSHTLTYALNGGSGSVPAAASYAVGATVTVTDVIPTKDGSTFDGWTDGSAVYQAGQTFAMSDSDVTLTALWTEAKSGGLYIDGTQRVQTFNYPVTVNVTVENGKITAFDADADTTDAINLSFFGQTLRAVQSAVVGKDASELEVQQLDAVSGATFSTTALRSGAIDALNADKVVTWKNADGEALDRAFHVTGILPIYDGETPTLLNHQFSGWAPELAPVTEDATYTAAFDLDPKYSVTYDLNGGTGDSDRKTFVIGKGDATLKAVWEEIQSVGQYVSNETTDQLVAIYTEEFGPGSENEFDITFDYLLSGSDTPLFVTFDVTDDNQIDLDSIRVDIQSDTYTAADFDAAVTAIRDMLALYGPDATVGNLQFVWTMLWIDETDGAEMPGYADIMLGMINALLQGVQEPQTPFAIVKQPVDYYGALNSRAGFLVEATGEGVTYQWQVSTNGGRTWSKSSVAQPRYEAKFTAEKNGRMVRCILTDGSGAKLMSDAVSMIISDNSR